MPPNAYKGVRFRGTRMSLYDLRWRSTVHWRADAFDPGVDV
jgi:hypothetical protein